MTNLSFINALFYTFDGNFRSNQKNKPMDPNDTPLTGGAGYFADSSTFDSFAKHIGAPDGPEVSTSSHHLSQTLTAMFG